MAAIPGEEVPAALSCLPIVDHASRESSSLRAGTGGKRIRKVSRERCEPPRRRYAAATETDEKFVGTGDFLGTSLGAKLLKLWEVCGPNFRRNKRDANAARDTADGKKNDTHVFLPGRRTDLSYPPSGESRR